MVMWNTDNTQHVWPQMHCIYCKRLVNDNELYLGALHSEKV